MYYVSVMRHNRLLSVLKLAYFMTVIDGLFWVGCACYKQTRDVSVVMHA